MRQTLLFSATAIHSHAVSAAAFDKKARAQAKKLKLRGTLKGINNNSTLPDHLKQYVPVVLAAVRFMLLLLLPGCSSCLVMKRWFHFLPLVLRTAWPNCATSNFVGLLQAAGPGGHPEVHPCS
jgi:hypothetical protein